MRIKFIRISQYKYFNKNRNQMISPRLRIPTQMQYLMNLLYNSIQQNQLLQRRLLLINSLQIYQKNSNNQLLN